MKSIVDFTNKLKDYFATKQALTNVKNDLTNVVREGSTNTGLQIPAGWYFYLDGNLMLSTADIATNATFTSSNCEPISSGGYNALNSKKSNRIYYKDFEKYGITNSSGTGTFLLGAVSDPNLVCIGAVLRSWDGVNSIAVPYYNNGSMYLMVYGSCNNCGTIVRGAYVTKPLTAT